MPIVGGTYFTTEDLSELYWELGPAEEEWIRQQQKEIAEEFICKKCGLIGCDCEM